VMIIQLYHDKVIRDEFWNEIQVFILTNGNTNQSQLPLLPLPFMVKGLNIWKVNCNH
jgi:hypothetical protein